MGERRPVAGVLGGLGPWATLEFFRRILSLTPARRDQDHLHLVIDDNPAVPERTAAIVGGGEDPLPALIEGVRRLERAGVDFIAIPCNTAHHWIEELAAASSVPVIDMVAEAAAEVQRVRPGVRCAGLLATSGTLASGIYRRRLESAGVDLIHPDPESQRELVMKAVLGEEGVKAGFIDGPNREWLIEAARRLVAEGAEVIIAGCTEIPLVLRPEDLAVPLVDTLDCLARAVLLRAGVTPPAPPRRPPPA